MARTSDQWASIIAPTVTSVDGETASGCTAHLRGNRYFGLTARLAFLRRRCQGNAAPAGLRRDLRVRTVNWDRIQGVKGLPGHAGGVSDPVLVRLRVAAGGVSLFDQCV